MTPTCWPPAFRNPQAETALSTPRAGSTFGASRFLLGLGTVLALLGTGCLRLQPQGDTTRFYVLSAPSNIAEAALLQVDQPNRPIFVERVEIPEYLQQPAIVTRHGPTRIVYSQEEHWAEPLTDGITRTLREELDRRWGTGALPAAGIRRPAKPHYELRVVLDQFECLNDHTAVLQARWEFVRQPERDVQTSRAFSVRRDFVDSPADALPAIEALSSCLEALAADIARTADFLFDAPQPPQL